MAKQARPQRVKINTRQFVALRADEANSGGRAAQVFRPDPPERDSEPQSLRPAVAADVPDHRHPSLWGLETEKTTTAELVEWQHVQRGDVVKMNRPNARWLMVHHIDQQWEPQFTHFDFVDVDGTRSHSSRPKREVIRRKLGASIYDQHREAVRRVLAEVDEADTDAMGA